MSVLLIETIHFSQWHIYRQNVLLEAFHFSTANQVTINSLYWYYEEFLESNTNISTVAQICLRTNIEKTEISLHFTKDLFARQSEYNGLSAYIFI